MNAAFMSFQPHETGVHAVWSGAGEASVTEVRFETHCGREICCHSRTCPV
jgi:hypothetical protein